VHDKAHEVSRQGNDKGPLEVQGHTPAGKNCLKMKPKVSKLRSAFLLSIVLPNVAFSITVVSRTKDLIVSEEASTSLWCATDTS
jgi:hypothetical protein